MFLCSQTLTGVPRVVPIFAQMLPDAVTCFQMLPDSPRLHRMMADVPRSLWSQNGVYGEDVAWGMVWN